MTKESILVFIREFKVAQNFKTKSRGELMSLKSSKQKVARINVAHFEYVTL